MVESFEVTDDVVRAFNAAWIGADDINDDVLAGLTAAAPLIAAQALRSAAAEIARRGEVFGSLPLESTADWLSRRADELERGTDQ